MNKFELNLLENINTVPYLSNSIIVLHRLIGAKIKNCYRLSNEFNDESDDDVLSDFTPVVLELNDGRFITIHEDEGMNNIFFTDTISDEKLEHFKIESQAYQYKLNIIDDFDSTILNKSDFNSEIVKIEIISKEHDFVGWHLMSGVSITLSNSNNFIIGTTLTDLEIQGIWILKSSEIDHVWNYNEFEINL